MKARIIETTLPNGGKSYTIQQRHFLFFWWWVPAWVNSIPSIQDTFNSLEEANKNLCFFDGTKIKQKIVCSQPLT